jgi:hypothetical protein
MSITKYFSLIFAFSSSLALAAPPLVTPIAQCPAIGDEYEALLTKLDNIKTSVRDGANCANVALKVQTLQDLLTTEREKILKIVEQGQTQALTPQQTEQVKNYAEEITKKVAALNDLFTGSNKCFRDDNAESSLASMSGFVSEAANLVGSLSGPWGTPIALAGHVVAGFMTGMDKVMKSRAGFDFSKPDSWKNYVQNLCTFHNYRDQVEHLLNPKARIAQLQSLKSQLDTQISALSARCEECQTIERTFDSQSVNSPEVQRADQRFAKPYGTYMLYSIGIRRWVATEIVRVEKESRSFWADVSGRHVLSQARADLEQFLVNRETPRFLNYQLGQSMRDFGTFQGFALQEGRALQGQFQAINPNIMTVNVRNYFTDPVEMFKALVISPLRWELVPGQQAAELKDSWTSYRDRSISRLRDAEMSLNVVQGFCSFFRQAGYYNSAVKQACTGVDTRQIAKQMSNLNGELAKAGVQSQFKVDAQVFDPNFAGVRAPKNGIESLSRSIQTMQP